MLGTVDFYDEFNKTKFHAEGFGKLFKETGNPNSNPWRQCGMAWATRRDVFEATNGSLDVCIGTKCDLYQNYAYLGQTFTAECNDAGYRNAIQQWQEKAIPVYQKKIGFVSGNIIHFNHCMGTCKTSSYDLMTQALTSHHFDPNHDMLRDSEGRLQFKDNFELAKDYGKYMVEVRDFFERTIFVCLCRNSMNLLLSNRIIYDIKYLRKKHL